MYHMCFVSVAAPAGKTSSSPRAQETAKYGLRHSPILEEQDGQSGNSGGVVLQQDSIAAGSSSQLECNLQTQNSATLQVNAAHAAQQQHQR